MLDRYDQLLEREIKTVEQERGVRFELGTEMQTAPALCDAGAGGKLSQARWLIPDDTAFTMPSGGGHDAAVFANAGIPSAIVFVRNRNGSHNPDEAMEIADLIAGTDVLFSFLTKTA